MALLGRITNLAGEVVGVAEGVEGEAVKAVEDTEDGVEEVADGCTSNGFVLLPRGSLPSGGCLYTLTRVHAAWAWLFHAVHTVASVITQLSRSNACVTAE